MRLLLSGTENYSQSLGTSLHSLFLSHLSEHSALAALPRADQSAANGSPVLCHSSAGSLKSIRRFMVDLERGKKTHLQARSYFLRLPFCSLCAEDKGGSGWRWGTGSGGDEIPRNKSSRSYAQWERIWGGGEHSSGVSRAGAPPRRDKRRRNAVEVFLQASGGCLRSGNIVAQ